MFRAHVLIIRRSKLHYTASGNITPIGGHLVYSLREELLEIHPNINNPSTPRSPQWPPTLRFPHQDPIHIPLLTHTRHMPSPTHSSQHEFDTRGYFMILMLRDPTLNFVWIGKDL